MSVRLPNIHFITPYVHDNNATVNMGVHIFVLYGKSKGLSIKRYTIVMYLTFCEETC